MNADQLPTTRKSILETLKREGKAAIADLAGRLGMSGEAVRQQLLQLQREGWVEAIRDEAHEKRSGRPAAHFRSTTISWASRSSTRWQATSVPTRSRGCWRE